MKTGVPLAGDVQKKEVGSVRAIKYPPEVKHSSEKLFFTFFTRVSREKVGQLINCVHSLRCVDILCCLFGFCVRWYLARISDVSHDLPLSVDVSSLW